MNNIKVVMKYEIKMMFRRAGYWAILVFALVISLADNFPSQSNLNRLSFLREPGYLVSRLLVQTGVFILFGVMFLSSNAIRKDKKGGTDQFLMVTNVSKNQYIAGKVLGNYIPSIILFGAYMSVHAVVQLTVLPEAFSLRAYLTGYFVLVLTAALFIVGLSVALPMWIDIRVCYVLMSAYFLANLLIVPDSLALPFWFLFYGDLIKVVYGYGFGTLLIKNLFLNFIFLLGAGLVSIISLGINTRFWREKCR